MGDCLYREYPVIQMHIIEFTDVSVTCFPVPFLLPWEKCFGRAKQKSYCSMLQRPAGIQILTNLI